MARHRAGDRCDAVRQPAPEPAPDAGLRVVAATFVPLVEGVGAGHHRIEELVGVLGNVVGLAAEVLGDQGSEQHAGERVLRGRVVEVATPVDDGARDLAAEQIAAWDRAVQSVK